MPIDATDRGERTILVVDDEPGLLELVSMMLRRAGYRSLTAKDGPRALELLGAEEGVSLLLSDVVMPGMTGPDLAAAARELRPTLSVAFMTGYANMPVGEAGAPLITKPFTWEELISAVDAALGVAAD